MRFFHSFVDSCIGKICHNKDFTGRVLLRQNFISPLNNLFNTKKSLARYRSPSGPHLPRMVQPIRSPGNPGTTVVSIGHWTPWPDNPGYRTQVWDDFRFCKSIDDICGIALNHWDRMMLIYILINYAVIGSDNALSPGHYMICDMKDKKCFGNFEKKNQNGA